MSAGTLNVITLVFKLAGYTYGPLLGLFWVGLFTRLSPPDRLIPPVVVAAPILAGGLITLLPYFFPAFVPGQEPILFSAGLTALGLYFLSLAGKTGPK
jgi:hypothetical protein